MAVKDITKETRESVRKRQENYSLTGVYLNEAEFHHFVTRGSQGVGYEWNIVALTPLEHRQLHDGADITLPDGTKLFTNKAFKSFIRTHLKESYRGWSEDKCKVHKGWNKEDYHIERNYE